MTIKLNKREIKILETISESAQELGVEARVIGGFVRDKILGRQSKDIDITCVGDGIELAKNAARRFNVKKNVNIYKNFGTALIVFDGYNIEFVGARKESYRLDSRKPTVTTGTMMDDLSRRDFTINTLSIDLSDLSGNKIIDNFDGLVDLQNKLLKTPLDPEITFSDDPLRMMRAIRFAAQLNFTIEEKTLEAIGKNKERIKIVSAERITDELQKIIAAEQPSKGFILLFETGLLQLIFPEFHALQGVEQIDKEAHKDNFFHTLQVLDNISDKSDNIWLRWGAILHDIGKAKTKKYIPAEGWTFHGHEVVGAKMVERIFKNMKLPLDHKMKFVQKLVRLHLRPMALVSEGVSDSAVRRLLFDAGDDIDELMMLAKADITSKNMYKVKTFQNNYDLVIQKLKDVEEKDKLRNWQPPVSGDIIMKVFGLKPCREVGIIKTEIREGILEGIIANNYEEAYSYMIKVGEKIGLKPISK
jgi:putative nucleotidyltransferase with HDIG domain